MASTTIFWRTYHQLRQTAFKIPAQSTHTQPFYHNLLENQNFQKFRRPLAFKVTWKSSQQLESPHKMLWHLQQFWLCWWQQNIGGTEPHTIGDAQNLINHTKLKHFPKFHDNPATTSSEIPLTEKKWIKYLRHFVRLSCTSRGNKLFHMTSINQSLVY